MLPLNNELEHIKIILHPAFKGDILWHFVWPPCWKGKITFWSRDHLRTYSFQENGAGLKITGHFILFKIRPTDRFRRQNHITCIFIKTMSHDLLAQLAYFTGTPSGSFFEGESAQAVKSQSLSTTVLYPGQHWSTSSCKTYFVRRNWRIAPINPWLA